MDLERSPLAVPFPNMPPIAGVTARVARAGYKDWGRCDLTYVELVEGTAVAGVFTRNVCCSSEVELGREQAKEGRARALVVNAGNSNAFTGYRGREAVEAIMAQVARHLGCDAREVFVSSTGVIGVPLPQDKARSGVAAALDAAECSWEEAAATIGTTDTFPKGATATAVIGGRSVTLCAIVKGSGMIAPDMATMLGYIFTDAAVEPAFLQDLLSAANARTFNCITVDSDTSTSDTVLAFATGKAGNAPLSSFDDPGADAFAAALHDVCHQLAHLVVRDGEDRDCGRGRQLGPRRHGGGQGRRTGGPRQALDRLRRPLDGTRWPAALRLRRNTGRRAPQRSRDPHRCRSRSRRRPLHGVDLRPDARLHRDQRGLPLVKGHS